MKNGTLIVLDEIESRSAAALLIDGKLQDLIVDPKDAQPLPTAIYRAKTLRPLKGQNGIIVDLGNGQKGYLKQAKGIAPGETMLVQVATHADEGKATPVTQKLIFKSRYAIITPDAPGINIARSITDEHERDRIAEIAHDAFVDAPENFGLILRSQCLGETEEDIYSDIISMLETASKVLADADGVPELLLDAPDAADYAWINWVKPDQTISQTDSFDTVGVWDHIYGLQSPECALENGASMIIEPTKALVAVDVNTGGDFSLNAGLKANLAVAQELPRQLKLRGLGGQIVIDFAPCPKKERRRIETEMRRAFKAGGVDTILVGWTPLGHFELQRKRERLPLTKLI